MMRERKLCIKPAGAECSRRERYADRRIWSGRRAHGTRRILQEAHLRDCVDEIFIEVDPGDRRAESNFTRTVQTRCISRVKFEC